MTELPNLGMCDMDYWGEEPMKDFDDCCGEHEHA